MKALGLCTIDSNKVISSKEDSSCIHNPNFRGDYEHSSWTKELIIFTRNQLRISQRESFQCRLFLTPKSFLQTTFGWHFGRIHRFLFVLKITPGGNLVSLRGPSFLPQVFACIAYSLTRNKPALKLLQICAKWARDLKSLKHPVVQGTNLPIQRGWNSKHVWKKKHLLVYGFNPFEKY